MIPDLYQSECFSCRRFDAHEAWEQYRHSGLGGSDASVVVGISKWKNPCELYREKRGGASDFKSSPQIEYGVTCEPALRTLYGAKHLDQSVQYVPDCTLECNRFPFLRYSPDGLLFDPEKGNGILEIKTYMFRNKAEYEADWGTWNNPQIKPEYYLQLLHGLIVTGFDFCTLTAEIRYPDNESRIIERTIYRDQHTANMDKLFQMEDEFWNNHVMPGIEPSLSLEI